MNDAIFSIQVTDGEQKQVLRGRASLMKLCGKNKEALILFSCRDAECSTCLVEVMQGAKHLSPVTPKEKELLDVMELPKGRTFRLGCQVDVEGDVHFDYIGDEAVE